MAKATAKTGKRAGGLQVGKNGLGLMQTFVKLFHENERAPKSKKLTDDQIVSAVLKQFPGRDRVSKNVRNVAGIRRAFNRGQWPTILAALEIDGFQSQAYDANGDVVPPRSRGAVKANATPTAPAKKTARRKVVKRKTAKVG